MSRMITGILAAAVLSVSIAACGVATPTGNTQPTAATMMEQPTADAMMEQPTADAMMEQSTADAMMEQPTAAAMMEQPTAAAMEQPTVAAVMEQPTAAAAIEQPTAVVAEQVLPAWQTTVLTDARTGETFSFADFAGKTVYVEPMATWCSKCKEQLGNVKQAKARLVDDVVFVGLSVETNISDADLASYADANGFDWRFAVLTPEALQQLVDAFGRTTANPPATPHFIIAPDGTVAGLDTGFVSADDLVTKLSAQR